MRNQPPRWSWDFLVRLIHWSVATLFLANYFFTEPGYELHTNFGWAILALVVVRILWGISFAKGPNHLRSFAPTLAGVQHHLQELKTRQRPQKVGHNPFGTVAIYLMWIGLSAAAFTGWLQDTDWGFDNGADLWHEWVVDGVFLLVILHVSAVVLTSLWLRANLIRAMVIGRLKPEDSSNT